VGWTITEKLFARTDGPAICGARRAPHASDGRSSGCHEEPDAQAFSSFGVIQSEPRRISPDQAAGCKRAALDIGTTWVSRGSPSVSQTSLSAFARLPISVSL